jgi:hypothetical protein
MDDKGQLPGPVTASLELRKSGKITDFSSNNPHEMEIMVAEK